MRIEDKFSLLYNSDLRSDPKLSHLDYLWVWASQVISISVLRDTVAAGSNLAKTVFRTLVLQQYKVPSSWDVLACASDVDRGQYL